MTVNRVRILRSDTDKKVTLPIANDFDESLGREQLIKLYERSEMQDSVNIIQDFETTRYSPDTDNVDKHIIYDMEFSLVSTPTGNSLDYIPDYSVVGISHPDIVDRKGNFTKSFFKFDFYDTADPQKQRLYFSVVNPANNGKSFSNPGMYSSLIEISNDPNSINYDPITYRAAEIEDLEDGVQDGPPYYYDKLESSRFEFSAVGRNTENYYIQWLKNRELVKKNVFFMTCKFFNAETGKVHKFINKVQPLNKYNLSIPEYYYYQITFDPVKFTYMFNEYDVALYNGNNGLGPKVGGDFLTPVRFYEYINP